MLVVRVWPCLRTLSYKDTWKPLLEMTSFDCCLFWSPWKVCSQRHRPLSAYDQRSDITCPTRQSHFVVWSGANKGVWPPKINTVLLFQMFQAVDRRISGKNNLTTSYLYYHWWEDVFGLSVLRALFKKQGLCRAYVYVRCPGSLRQDENETETCIICNRYHSLMVSALPMAAHNGPFLRFSASCSAFWWWQNGDSECHLGRNKKNDGTFHLLVTKLALQALDTMCMHALVQGVVDTTKDKKIPFKLKKMFHLGS